jgi:hypothetical protein
VKIQVSIPNSEVQQLEISESICGCLVSAEFECGTAIKSSDALMSSQSSVIYINFKFATSSRTE